MIQEQLLLFLCLFLSIGVLGDSLQFCFIEKRMQI